MDNEEDKYIKDIFKKDDLISKNADDIFNKFIKGEFEVEENKISQEQEAKITQTKDKVVETYEGDKTTPEKILCKLSGYSFYNTSRFDLKELLND